MPLTNEQFQKMWLISDTILYPEAVAFMRHLVKEKECRPLASSQVNGLLQIAEGSSYADLYTKVLRQRERNWAGVKADLKIFYTELEKMLSDMYKRRIRDEFGLARKAMTAQEEDEVMSVLAREFIQHLVAENGLLDVAARDARNTRKG